MNRVAQITFLKSLTNGTPATVIVEDVKALVLRDALLAEFQNISERIHFDVSTPKASVYETREAMLRILDRIDGRGNGGNGRSFMKIGGTRITVDEEGVIRTVLGKILEDNPTDAKLRTAMKFSQTRIKTAVRRHCMESLIDLLREEESTVETNSPKEAS